MKLLELNHLFIEEHMDELVTLEDWVPLSFGEYDKQQERDDFLMSKNLLATIRDMDDLINQKCNFHENSIKAYNSVLIEWLDIHSEFEGIISNNSIIDYQNMKNNANYIEFVDLLFIKLPSEEVPKKNRSFIEGMSIKDDSFIQLPDFEKMAKMYELFPNTILACYLAYIV